MVMAGWSVELGGWSAPCAQARAGIHPKRRKTKKAVFRYIVCLCALWGETSVALRRERSGTETLRAIFAGTAEPATALERPRLLSGPLQNLNMRLVTLT